MGVLYPLETLAANFFVKQAVRFQLGVDYLGLQNVYTNFCDILTFAFTGIGIAMMFRLYRPIENNDERMVGNMFRFFEKIYRYFTLGAGGVGILLTGIVILSVKTDSVGVFETALGYLLYLLSSLIYNRVHIYYFYLSAWQKRYVACLIHSLTDLLALGVEIGCLVLFKNYIIFLCSIILKNIVEAVILYAYSNRHYPYLKLKNGSEKTKVTGGVLSDILHMIIAKIGNLLVGSTDSILISALVSTFASGCYSGYYFLYLGLTTVTSSFYESIMNRVGKQLVTRSRERQFRHFIRISFLNIAIAAIVVSGFFWLCEDFIVLWMGEELLLGREIVLLVSINLYMCISRHSVSIYRQSAGLFKPASWVILAWGILNLILSLILGLFFGMFGILIATSISNFLTIYWYEPFIIYKFFHKRFFLAIIYELAAAAACASTIFLTGLIAERIPADNWLLLFFKTAVLVAAAIVWVFLIVWIPYELYRRGRKEKLSGDIAEEERISVIVCVYNVGSYVTECLDSVLCQTYQNLEILVVDDGSTDESGKICDAYAEKDPRVRVIHQENQGLSAARNAGSFASTGAYLSFLDGDDVLHPEYFSCLYQELKTNAADISVVGYRVFEEKKDFGRKIVFWEPTEVLTGREAAAKIIKDHEPKMITSWGKLYDRKLREVLLYPVGKIHEDEFTTYKVFCASEKVAVNEMKMYGLRKRQGSITSAYSLKRLEKLEALKECIAWCGDREDEQLADYAKIRYILNLQIAWYNINTKMKGMQEAEEKIIMEHRRAADEYWDKVKPLALFSEKCAVRAFLTGPEVYRFFAGVYRIFVKERG